MTGLLSFAWLLLLLAVAGWVFATALLPLLIPIGLSSRVGPAERRRRLWLLAALPWILPLTLVLSALLLAAGQRFGFVHDHCLLHGPGHPHLCLTHLPSLFLSYPEFAAAGLLGTYFLLLCTRFATRESRQAHHIGTLAGLSSRARGCLHILDDNRVIGFVAGLRNPAIFLSQGLLDSLGPRERRIVVAHEAAHLRHRDLQKRFAFEFFLMLHLPWTASRLRMQWRRAIEEHADDQVAQRFGALDVASTLLAVSKSGGFQPRVGLSVAGTNPAERIQRLLTPATHGEPVLFRWLYLAALAAMGAAIFGGHHQVETLLGLAI
ncbi:M56 family metallopeptidase [Gilvimarinus sp. F26214L]|uniref:M56 family metallopeptidase n=1 Tax=Gilvimarinus sp. DZF01 TaxID=3461371 RepID=UPI0040459842